MSFDQFTTILSLCIATISVALTVFVVFYQSRASLKAQIHAQKLESYARFAGSLLQYQTLNPTKEIGEKLSHEGCAVAILCTPKTEETVSTVLKELNSGKAISDTSFDKLLECFRHELKL